MTLSTVIETIQGMPAFSILFKITVLLALGWTAQAFFRHRHPEWRILLWRALILGCLAIPVLDLFQPFTLYELKIFSPQSVLIHTTEDPTVSLPDIPVQPVLRPESHNPLLAQAAAITETQDIQSFAMTRSWSFLLSVLWALGTLLGFMRLAYSWHRLHALQNRSQAAPDDMQNLLNRVARDLRCTKTVPLCVNPEINTPYLQGISRPKIHLPFLYKKPEYREDLSGILAHELTHLQNRDLAWKLIFECFLCLLWFHPLAWRVSTAHDFACEEICDRTASRYVGCPEQYTRTLARAVLDSRVLLPGCAVLPFARPSNIHQRLRRLQTAITTPLSRKALLLYSLPLLLVIGGINGIVWTEAQQENQLSSSPSPIDNADDPQALTITGQVVDEAGQPLSPAEVKVYVSIKNRREEVATTQTNADGTYSLSLPQPGNYFIESTPSPNYLKKFQRLTIEADTRLEFKHAPAPLHVQGTVVEAETGLPIVGARITMIPVLNPAGEDHHPDQTRTEGITDTNGVFLISRLSTGYFAFSAEAKGHISLSPEDNDQTPNPYLRVLINEQTQSHSFPIELAKGNAVRIRVIDSEKMPVPQAEVNIHVNGDLFRGYQQSTDENGECLFDTLTPGTAAALVKKESVGETISETFQTGSQENSSVITVALPKSATITGIVRDTDKQPVTQRTVNIFYSELGKRIPHWRTTSGSSTQTDETGRYTFSGLGEGEYTFCEGRRR